MKKIFFKIKFHYSNSKNELIVGNFLDKIEYFKIEISFVISSILAYCYLAGDFNSVRVGLSDVLTLSSIILGILGVFIAILMSAKEGSPFFEKAAKHGKAGCIYNNLMLKIKNNFLLNIFFIVLTASFNYVPATTKYIYLKIGLIGFWIMMCILILWGIYFIIDTIVKISLFEEEKIVVKKKS